MVAAAIEAGGIDVAFGVGGMGVYDGSDDEEEESHEEGSRHE